MAVEVVHAFEVVEIDDHEAAAFRCKLRQPIHQPVAIVNARQTVRLCQRDQPLLYSLLHEDKNEHGDCKLAEDQHQKGRTWRKAKDVRRHDPRNRYEGDQRLERQRRREPIPAAKPFLLRIGQGEGRAPKGIERHGRQECRSAVEIDQVKLRDEGHDGEYGRRQHQPPPAPGRPLCQKIGEANEEQRVGHWPC